MYQTKQEQQNLDSYNVAGIKIKSVAPKKEYQLEYKGKMVVDSSFRKEVDVEMFAVWRSNCPTFDFSTELSDIAKSEALALEPWSRKYFKNLRRYTLHSNSDTLLYILFTLSTTQDLSKKSFSFRNLFIWRFTCRF